VAAREDRRPRRARHAERRALFVGLWPPTMWLLGDAVEQYERR
jgi:hypothetical protein